MTNQTNDVIRDAKQLGIPKMLILGLQHMFAMFGATILVPILVNSYFTRDSYIPSSFRRLPSLLLCPRGSPIQQAIVHGAYHLL